MSNYSVEQQAVLQIRVVHPERIVKNLTMKAAVTTTCFKLRTFIAAQGGQDLKSIKLIFQNEIMNDSLTLRQHGIVDLAIISVLFGEGSKKKKKIRQKREDAKSTGSKRKRTEDDMSIASKRTKVDNDGMSVSTTVTTRRETEASKPACEPDRATKTKRTFWKKCEIQTGTLVGGKEKNEDAVVSFQSVDGRVNAVGVFDGHGQSSFAAVSSQLSSKVAKAWFIKFADEMPNWDAAMWHRMFDRLFMKMHEVVRQQFEKMELHLRSKKRYVDSDSVVDDKGVVRMPNGNPIHGGTTVSISVLIRKDNGQQYVVTANVGDSDVIIAKQGMNNVMKLEVATEAHRAHNRSEFMRIKNLPDEEYPVKLDFVYDVQGVNDPRLLPKVYNSSGELNESVQRHPAMYGLYSSNVRSEPATYAITPTTVKEDRARLANTRAIGDFYAEQFGLSHIPDVSIQHLPPHESFYIVAGSDGVWDIMEYCDVVSWVQDVTDNDRLQEYHVAQYLHEVKRKSHKFFGALSAVDDASLCILYAPKGSYNDHTQFN